MYIYKVLLISILFFNGLNINPKDKSLFISPVNIPLALSANFGELRIDHFHSGLDIKTQGVTGKDVLASAEGYVYRISVSPGGFGKALYLRHPSGYSTVYAHLDRFIPEIDEYVKTRQYEEKSFMVTLFPPREKFRFKQGDLIAYSGNSGSSNGPHLHYEIRESDGEKPVNPLHFEFGIEDDFEPVIERLMIYPLNGNTLINNRHNTLKLKTAGGNGNYYIPSGSEIVINGPAGFGIKSYDLLNNSYNKCSIYMIELKIDSQSVFNYRMDEFSFDETRYINSHIDYESFIKENAFIERAFVLPNDKLSVYGNLVKRGIFNFNDGKKHHIEIRVADFHGNTSSVTFYVRAGKPGENSHTNTVKDHLIAMPYSRNNKYVSGNIIVNIPSGTLYDTLFFNYRKTAGNSDMFSDIHQVHDRFTPVHKPYTLSIKPSGIPAGKESKLLIVHFADDMKKIPLRSSWENGYVTASPGSFGAFYVGIDTVPPVISPNGFRHGSNLSGMKELKLKVTDNFSGLKSYEPVIDGKWALFEYDQKTSTLIYKFDSKRIAKGVKHKLSVKAVDNRDNSAMYNYDFTW